MSQILFIAAGLNRNMVTLWKSSLSRAYLYVSYFNLLYFFEILSLMITLFFLYGRMVSVISGFLLAALLTLQIISVYYRKGISRYVQIFMMDIHLAYSIVFVAGYLAGGSSAPPIMTVIRAVCIPFELYLILLLTDGESKKNFS